MGNYTSVGLRATPNLQVILGLKPDLIIADSERQKGIYDQLSTIAPTVEFPSVNANYKQTLASEQLAAVALNRCAEFKQSLDKHAAFMKNTIDKTWESSPLWKSIPAVGKQQVFPVDQNSWSRSRGIDTAELIATQAIKDLYNKNVTP